MKSFLVLVLAISAVSAAPSIRLRRRGVDPRITGGHDARRGQFPYQVSYQWGIFGIYEHVCGASVISPTWLVTAGHCVTSVPKVGEHKIIAGFTSFTDPGQVYGNVVEMVVHPNFGGDVGPNDIALLRLEEPLQFNDLIQPIALPEPNSEPVGPAVLSGWGSVSTIILPILPITLQTVDVDILDNQVCRNALDLLMEGNEENPFDSASNICTGPLDNGISACSGDSGGPVAQNGQLVGVVSWGMLPCGSKGAPSVYTRVSNFIDFIKAHVKDLP